jgi:hypothetical protein
MAITADSLVSGLIGALIGSGLAVVYQHVSMVVQRRFEVMLLAVDYFDELYYQSRNIQQYKEKKYKEHRDAFSPERYMELCEKTDFLLTSSRVHARVALTYGESSKELDNFNKLRTKLTDAALLLFRSKPETWDDTSKKVAELFEKEIDPLRQNTEVGLIRSTKLKAVLCSIVGFRRC